MADDTFLTPPLMAQVYNYQTTDTIVSIVTSDAGGAFPLANIIGEDGPNLNKRGRTTTAATNDGFRITLISEIVISCAEVLGIADSDSAPLSTSQIIQLVGEDAGLSATFVTGSAYLVVPSVIYTAHDSISDDPVRLGGVIAGYDVMVEPPTAPLVVDTANVKVMKFLFRSAGASFIEVAYLALGVNARELGQETSLKQGIDQGSIKYQTVRMQNGYGYRTTVTWQRMTAADAKYITETWKLSQGGTSPIFFFPAADSKSATGTLDNTRNTEETRGGLMRMLDWTHDGYEQTSQGQEATNCVLNLETWQGSPIIL